MTLSAKQRAFLQRATKWLGIAILSRNQIARNDEVLTALLGKAVAEAPVICDSTLLAEGVVFSKDRPLQLAATLGSFLEHVRGNYSLHILYASSSEKFQNAYDELRASTSSPKVHWHNETQFKPDLLKILAQVRANRIFFLVDDLIVTREIELSSFCLGDLSEYVPSFRLGTNLRRCYTADARQPLPQFTPISDDLLTWSWHDAEWDWSYPLSVDGHIFPTAEIQVLASILDYKAPNTFEGALQAFAGVYSRRRGLCARQSCLVNIPHNRVQDENDNRSQGLSAEQLLDSWCDGYRIDYQSLSAFHNISAHQEVPLPLHRPQTMGNALSDA
jgi:hypothetical protein